MVVCERVGPREVVRAASVEARHDGVRIGMRRREAEAACPGVEVVAADPAAEARGFEVVARAVEGLTPRFEIHRPGLLTFPTRGPSRYHGGDDRLAALVHRHTAAVLEGPLGASGDAARVGVADSRFGAILAARRARPVLLVAPGETGAFLAPFPVDLLDDPKLSELLVRLGLPTLGDFAALAPEAVLARFGVEGRRRHQLARGFDDTPPVLAAAPADLVEVISLEPPASRVDEAAFAAKALADRLIERLAAEGLACTRVMVEAETEHGETMARHWRHDHAFTPATLAERVRWQLDGWLAARVPAEWVDEQDPRARQDGFALAEAGLGSTTGALARLRLVPDEVVVAPTRQLGFWRGDAAAADRADRCLARVQGMLGYEAVVTPLIQGGRTPTERVHWVPWGEPREPLRPLELDGVPLAWPGSLPAPFPARCFEPGVPAELLDAAGRPVQVGARGEAAVAPAQLRSPVLPGGAGQVVGWAGPWPYDLRWWDRRARRRGVHWQVLVACGPDSEVGCLVRVEAGVASVDGIYD